MKSIQEVLGFLMAITGGIAIGVIVSNYISGWIGVPIVFILAFIWGNFITWAI